MSDFKTRLSISSPVFEIMASMGRILTLRHPWEFSLLRSWLRSGKIENLEVCTSAPVSRSSLHSYLMICEPTSPELMTGIALVARLTALLDQFPHQVF